MRAVPTVRAAWLTTTLVVAAAVIGLSYAVTHAAYDPVDDHTTATVGVGDIEDVVTALGKIQPRRYVDVGAQVSGQLMRIRVQPGDQVKAGDLLAEIDPRLQVAKVDSGRAQLELLKAQLADAQAQAEYAVGEFRRQTQLKRDNATRDDVFAMARRDMRSAASKVDAIRAQIQQADSALRADEAQLGYTRIYAPMDGTVVSVDAREGQTINANYSAPVLMRIADLTSLTVWTQVSEADVTRLTDGMELYFTTLGYGDRRWMGTLRQILPAPVKPVSSNAADQNAAASAQLQTGVNNVVLYTALFDVPNSTGELRPEMSAQVFFIAAAAKGVVIAPMAALSRADAASGLYVARVVAGTRVETRQVRIGIHDRFNAQVLGGLVAGEQVVTGLKSEAGRLSLIGWRL
jgi:membrane fusion protein, macrolide-specific efflux system